LERCNLKFPLCTAKLDKLNSELILIPSSRELTKIEDLKHTKDL
jgi:hypothetical protein